MNEKDYIIASDRVRITHAKSMLSSALPGINPLINDDEHSVVMRILAKWERAHFAYLTADPDEQTE